MKFFYLRNKIKRDNILLFLFILLGILILSIHSIVNTFSILTTVQEPYLILLEKIANVFFNWSDYGIYIKDHIAFYNKLELNNFNSRVMFKTYSIVTLLLVWICTNSNVKKILFSVLIILLHILLGASYIGIHAYELSSSQISNSVYSIFHAIVIFTFCIVLFVYRYSKKQIVYENNFRPYLITWFDLNLIKIIIVFLGFSLVILSGIIDFEIWINLLLVLSQKILGILGKETFVDNSILFGDSSAIEMKEPCLGIFTMFLFVSLVFLSNSKIGKKSNYTMLFYMISGVLLLNVVNVIRVVFLYIYIAENGTLFAMDVHDSYNLVIYGVVFFLWVIWFEFFLNRKRLNTKE